MNQKLVTIGVGVYNSEKHLASSLNSLLAQTYQNFELIIADDNSTDKSRQIIEEFAKKDQRIKYYFNKENKGLCGNFNYLVSLAQGKYFMCGDDDDLWEPDFLEKCIHLLEEKPELVLAATVTESFSEIKGEKIVHRVDPGLNTLGNSPEESFKKYRRCLHSGDHIGGLFKGVYKIEALRNIRPYQTFIAGDHNFIAELLLNGPVETINETLFYKRWGGASKSVKKLSKVMGINPIIAQFFPYSVSEIDFQKMIWTCPKLKILEKIKLSIWSIYYYIWIYHIYYPSINTLPKIKNMLLGDIKINNLKKPRVFIHSILPHHILQNVWRYFKK
ncbi:MAG: glycosyltransferase family 2 protein [Halobacteriovoraceae bacterium]|nr:glycosyltransferase family 2 protein [Halobacteriovoraceae bacterium]